MRIILSGMIGGFIIFMWGVVSWGFIPWHIKSLHGFTDQRLMARAFELNVPTSGVYFLPIYQKQGDDKDPILMKSPMVIASVYLPGLRPSMLPPILFSMLLQTVAAMFVTWMLSMTTLGYIGRVSFTVVFALVAGAITQLPLWAWFGLDIYYVGIQIADLVIAWFLGGIVIAAMVKNKKAK